MESWERSENWPECTQIIHWKMQVTKGNLNFTCLENALFELILRTKICRRGWDTTTPLWRAGEKPLRATVCFFDRAALQRHGRIQLFRERFWEKMCTRKSRKVIWHMINTLFLTLKLSNLLLLLSFSTRKHTSMASRAILLNFLEELEWTQNHPQ